MVCDSILAFCKKCSEEKEAKTETEKEKEAKTSTEKEEKPKETVTLTHLNGTEEEVPKDRIKILKESVL
jgi:hypothetical protein